MLMEKLLCKENLQFFNNIYHMVEKNSLFSKDYSLKM